MAHLRASDSDVELSGSGASSEGASSEGARPRQRKRQRSSLKRPGELSAARRRQQASSLAEAGPSVTDSGAAGNHARYVPWTKEEDDRLRQLVEQLGPKNWSNIAAQMNNRTSKSCRLRWLNQLRPNVQTGGFTPEEDLVIMDAQAKLGNKWTAIAAMLPGRTDNAVKNRWNSALRKRLEGAVGAPPELMQQDAREQNAKREQTPSLQQAQAQAQQQAQQQAQAQQAQQQAQAQAQQQQAQVQAQQQQDDQQQMFQQQQQEQQQAKQQQALFSQLFAGHPHELSSSAWNQGLDAGRQAMMSGARPLPTPPPSSTALVATAPPFQLPLPFMTLQSQMSASEAAAMLAAANCDMLKKVSEATPMISATATVTSTAMVALAPPPAMMSMSSAGAPEQGQVLQQAPQPQDPSAAQPQQHQSQAVQQPQPQLNNPSLSTMRRVMSTHLAVKLLQQQQQHAPPPATMAMVACTPPPAVMTIPVADAKAAGSQPPAVSWQLPADLTRADSLPTVDLPGVPFMGLQAGPSQPGAGGKDVSVKQEPMEEAWQAAANRQPTAQQQQQPAVQPQMAAPGLAHQLLMLQQQVLQRQQQQAQTQVQQQVQSQQQQAQQQQTQQQAQAQQQQQVQQQQQAQQQQQQQQAQQQQPQVPQQAPSQLQQAQAQVAPQDQQAQAAMMQQLAWQLQGSSTPAAHRQSDPTAPAPTNRPPSMDTGMGGIAATSMAAPPMHVHSITASASASGLGTGAGGSGGSPASASKLLAGLLESSATRSAVPSSLVRVVAAGGAEAVEHLLALGWGTLTAAAALRQQTHSSNTLSMAQMQTASHPSADALLQWTGAHSHGGMHGSVHGGHSHDAHGGMHASSSHAAGASAHDAQHPMLPPPMQHQGVPDLGPCLGSIIQQAQQHHHQQHHHHRHQPSLLIDGSPLGSMSDLMALCDPGTLVDLERVAGSLSLARHPHQPEGATVDDAGGMHVTQHDPDSPASLEQLLGSDNALHRFMQQPEGASSPNLTHLLEGFGDGADIVMHCATHG